MLVGLVGDGERLAERTTEVQRAVFEYRYEGVLQYCWKTRRRTAMSCTVGRAAN